MEKQDCTWDEQNIKAQGKEAFKTFYKDNRKKVFRGEQGIDFPLLYTNEKVYQGAGPIISHLAAGSRLKGCIGRSEQGQGRISGLNIHGCSLDTPDSPGPVFLDILKFFATQGLIMELDTDGRNPEFLKKVIEQNLVRKLTFILRGPARLYADITGTPLDQDDLAASLRLLGKAGKGPTGGFDYKIILPVAAFMQKEKGVAFLSPEQAADAAAFAQEATGSKTHPFFIAPQLPAKQTGLSPLADPAFFKYRTQCRRYMVKTEILKT